MSQTTSAWRHARLWPSLLAYWFTCMVGAGVLARVGEANSETGWITIVMLIVVIVCMITERGRWKLQQRVGFVFFAWIAHSIFAFSMFIPVGAALSASGRLHLLERTVTFLATLPVLIFAMRQSRIFVSTHIDLRQ